MPGERQNHRRPAEISAGFASLVIVDEDDLIERIRLAETRQLIASHWYEELEHPNLLESTVWLERFDTSERSLHGQILIDPLNIGPSDHLLMSIFQYLVITADQSDHTIPVALRTDASERFELAVGAHESSTVRIRTESYDADNTEKSRDAHQINLAFRLSDPDCHETTRQECREFFRLWLSVQDCISELSDHRDDQHPPKVEIVVPQSRISADEMVVWQILTKYESDYHLLHGSLPELEIRTIDITGIAGLLADGQEDLLRQALAMVAARKLESLGATGRRDTITNDDLMQAVRELVANAGD